MGLVGALAPLSLAVLRQVDAPELKEFDTSEQAVAFAQKPVQSGVNAYCIRERVESGLDSASQDQPVSFGVLQVPWLQQTQVFQSRSKPLPQQR